MRIFVALLSLGIVLWSQTPVVRTGSLQSGATQYCRSTTGNDTYVCGLTPTLTAYTRGGCVVLDPDFANIGAATLNIDSLGAKSILKQSGAALSDSDIVANKPKTVCYDGTQYIIQGDGGDGSTNSIDTYANCVAGSTSSGSLCKPTDSPYFLVANGSSWIHWVFGFNVTPPADTGYTSVNADASFSVTTTEGGIRLCATAGSGFQIRIKAYPSPPFTKIFHVLFHGYDALDGAGMVLRDSASGRIIAFYAEFESNAKMLKVDTYNSPTSGNANVASRGFEPGFVMHSFKIEDNSTNHIFYHSMNGGITWHQILSQSRTAWLANPDGIGITITRGSTGGTCGWFLGEQ